MPKRVIIVGAGHAGMNTARCLRDEGWDGEIVLVSEEDVLPYERPPLSKDILTGQKSVEDIMVAPNNWLGDLDIQFLPGTRIDGIDAATKTLQSDDNISHSFDYLVLATGSNARKLNLLGSDSSGVVTLRSLDQAIELRNRLTKAKRLVVIGGGLIGLEAAASARTLGVEATVLEREHTLMSRMMPAPISSKILELHRQHGTEIVLNADVEAIIGESCIEAVKLKSGERLEADTVLVAAGGVPNIAIAAAAGLKVDMGILVDEFLRTTNEHIFACGDIAQYQTDGGTMRQESWKNAIEQSSKVAANIMGKQLPYKSVPWMWSDQFDKVVQVAGIPNASQTEVRRLLANDGIMTFHLSPEGVLQAAAAFGDLSQVSKPIRFAMSMIEKEMRPTIDELADPGTDLRAILKSHRAKIPTSTGETFAAASQ